MKTLLLAVISTLLITSYAKETQAHERYLVPSHTLLSGDKAQYVTATASISNAIFHPDRPLGNNEKGIESGQLSTLFNLLEETVIKPDGSRSDVSWQAFQRLSVADVLLEQSGTYRISLVQPDVHMTTFKKADGTPWRLFGETPDIPEGATDIIRRTTQSRVESFVTFNQPNQAAVTPTGVGVELAGETHPNDLFAGEQVNFTVFFQGKPLKQIAKVKLIKAGTRHRNDRQEKVLTINKRGELTFTPESAGFYFLGIETQVKVPQPTDVDVKHFSLYLSLEVFPE